MRSEAVSNPAAGGTSSRHHPTPVPSLPSTPCSRPGSNAPVTPSPLRNNITAGTQPESPLVHIPAVTESEGDDSDAALLREYDIEGGGASDLLGYENEDEDDDEAFEEDDGDDIDGGDDDDNEDNGDDVENYEATKRATRVRASRRAEGNRRAGGRKTQQAMEKQWNVSYY